MLVLAGCGSKGVGPDSVAGKQPDATVSLTAVTAAYIGSASAGSGALLFNGQSYPFNIGGAGIGGIGASSIDGIGSVYNLRDISQFAGAYAEARYGFAFGDHSAGTMWLQNQQGVIMEIHARRTGLMLSLGGDAMVVSLK